MTRKKLIRTFGSVRGLKLASQDEIAEVVGASLALAIREYLAGSLEPVTASAADDMLESEV